MIDNLAAKAVISDLLDSQTHYSIKLQRLIEAFCRGDDPLPYPELHHSKKLVAFRAAQNPELVESYRCPVHGLIEGETECPRC